MRELADVVVGQLPHLSLEILREAETLHGHEVLAVFCNAQLETLDPATRFHSNHLPQGAQYGVPSGRRLVAGTRLGATGCFAQNTQQGTGRPEASVGQGFVIPKRSR